MGKPVVAGTGSTVELILEKLAAGETFEQILEAHPRLTREAIQAALDFAPGLCGPSEILCVRRLDLGRPAAARWPTACPQSRDCQRLYYLPAGPGWSAGSAGLTTGSIQLP